MIDPILITGCPRSGTTMTAGIIYLCGAFGGNINGPSKRDDGGMFGNTELRLVSAMKIMSGEIERLVEEQGYKEGPWFYKDTTLCREWTIWSSAFPNAKWIIVRREKEDIVFSCMKTGYMNRFNKEVGWRSWVDAYLHEFEKMKSAGLDMTEVWPTKFIEGDFSEIRETVEKLGLKWEKDKVMNFIDPELRGSQL